MKFGCSSQSFNKAISSGRLDLKNWIRLCSKELRVEGIEIEDKDILSTDRKYLEGLQKIVAENHLVISNIALYNNFGMATKEANEEEFAGFEKYLSASRFLDLKIMRIFAGWPKSDDPQMWNQMVGYVKKCCKVAEEAGIMLVIENHNHGGFLRKSEDVIRLFGDVGSKNLKLLLDTGNYIDGMVSIEKTIHFARHIHAKMNALDAKGNEKNINYEKIIALCKDPGYHGFMSVEYEGSEDEFTAVPRGLDRLRQIYKEVYSK